MFRSSFYVTSFFLDHWYYAESHKQSDSSSVLQYYSKDSSYLYLQTKGSPGQPDLLDNAHFFFSPLSSYLFIIYYYPRSTFILWPTYIN